MRANPRRRVAAYQTCDMQLDSPLARRINDLGFSPLTALALLALLSGLLAADVPTHGARGAAAYVAAAIVAALSIAVVPTAAALRGTGVDAFTAGAACSSTAAAAIHFAVIDEHIGEYWLFGALFAVTATAQLAWAVVTTLSPRPWLLVGGIVGNLGVAAVWLVSRTAGLPIGPEAGSAEAVGLADVAATAFELVVVAGAVVVLARRRPHTRLSTRGIWLLALPAIVVTTLALAPITSHGVQHEHGAAAHHP